MNKNIMNVDDLKKFGGCILIDDHANSVSNGAVKKFIKQFKNKPTIHDNAIVIISRIYEGEL